MEIERGVFFQNLVERDADLLLVLARPGLYGEGDGRLWELYAVVDDRRGLVRERVARLRVFELDAGDDVAGVRLFDLVQLLALHGVQSA
ncbi:MAG TPA: hypothetical protein VJT74_17820 [Pyrinomonadaceae bacterium]|nr:hypothetical protein [Pyrinomonadaceae bacterium]